MVIICLILMTRILVILVAGYYWSLKGHKTNSTTAAAANNQENTLKLKTNARDRREKRQSVLFILFIGLETVRDFQQTINCSITSLRSWEEGGGGVGTPDVDFVSF